MNILVEEKLEFWRENVDFGVLDVGDFKFLGLGMRFERNKKKRFWIFIS